MRKEILEAAQAAKDLKNALEAAQAAKDWENALIAVLRDDVGFSVAGGIAERCNYADGAFDQGPVELRLPFGMAKRVVSILNGILPAGAPGQIFEAQQINHHTVLVSLVPIFED